MKHADINLKGVPAHISYIPEYKNEKTVVFHFYDVLNIGKEWKSFPVKYKDQEFIVPSSVDQKIIFEKTFSSVKEKKYDTHRMKVENNLFQSSKNFNSLEQSVKLKLEFNSKLQSYSNYQFLDDRAVKDLLEKDDSDFSHRVQEAFKVLNPGAYKADLLRYYLLYTRGGVWLDDKSMLRLPIINPQFGLDVYDGFFVHNYNESPLETGFFGARKGHSLVQQFLTRALENVEARVYTKSNMGITGPFLVKTVLEENKLFFDEGSSLEYKNTTSLVLDGRRNKLFTEKDNLFWSHSNDINSTIERMKSKNHYYHQWSYGTVYTDNNSNKLSSLSAILCPIVLTLLVLFLFSIKYFINIPKVYQ